MHKQKEVLIQYEHCVDEEQQDGISRGKNRLEEIIVHEEIYWKQRAKSFWLLEGDLNSKFFTPMLQ